MDPFTLATGIAGLLSISMELTRVIRGYIDGVKNHPKDVKELLEKVEALNQVLQQLEEFLRAESTKGTSFDQTSALCSANTTCAEKLKSLTDKLSRHTKGNKLIQSLGWPFNEEENFKSIRMLDGYIQTFHFSLTIGGCTLLSKTSYEVSQTLSKQLEALEKVTELSKMLPTMSATADEASETSQKVSAILITIATFPEVTQKLSDISNTVSEIDLKLKNSEQERVDKELREHRKSALEWLSPLTFYKRHHAISSLRQPNTGEWFLESQGFKEWLGSDTSSVLWCPGIPGAGKTVMTSYVVDYLNDTADGSNQSAIIAKAKGQISPTPKISPKSMSQKID